MAKKNTGVTTDTRTMDEIKADLEKKAAEWNDAHDFAEFKEMKKLEADMAADVAAYTEKAKLAYFETIKDAENPMLEIARTMTFPTLKAKEVVENDVSQMRIVPATKAVDPYDLHKRTPIGANPMWPYTVERLNMLFTAATAKDLGLDPKTVKNTMAMHEEAEKLALAGDKGNTRKLEDVQRVMDEMLGVGYTATPKMVKYLEKAHENTRKGSMSVRCQQHSGMRCSMVVVCHAAVTGEDFVLEYKVKKTK